MHILMLSLMRHSKETQQLSVICWRPRMQDGCNKWLQSSIFHKPPFLWDDLHMEEEGKRHCRTMKMQQEKTRIVMRWSLLLLLLLLWIAQQISQFLLPLTTRKWKSFIMLHVSTNLALRRFVSHHYYSLQYLPGKPSYLYLNSSYVRV